MPAIFDLNNVFVYYLVNLASGPSRKAKASAPQPRVQDYLDLLDADQVSLSLTNVVYNPDIVVANLQGQPEVLASSTFENGSAVMNSSVFRQSNTTSASFSTSFTEGIKIGAQTKLTTKIPFIAQGEVTLSAEGSFSSTQSVSSTDTQTFAVDTTVNVPPHSRVKATLMINSLEYSGKLSARVQVDGRLRITLDGDRKTVQIPELFTAVQNQPPGPGGFRVTDGKGQTFSLTASDVSAFQVVEDDVQYAVTADIDAKFGASQTVEVQQFDATSGELVNTSSLAA